METEKMLVTVGFNPNDVLLFYILDTFSEHLWPFSKLPRFDFMQLCLGGKTGQDPALTCTLTSFQLGSVESLCTRVLALLTK